MYAKILIAGISMLVLTGASHSPTMKKCDDATVAMVMKEVAGAPAAKKEMAMMEFKMAKDKMAANMNKECSMHLEAASKASMKK